MKIKIEIELDTIRDREEIEELMELIDAIRNKEHDEEYDD